MNSRRLMLPRTNCSPEPTTTPYHITTVVVRSIASVDCTLVRCWSSSSVLRVPSERLRSLVSKIVLTLEDGKLAIDLHGDPAGILAIANAKAHRRGLMGSFRGQSSLLGPTASLAC
jgi:hypothetical protein